MLKRLFMSCLVAFVVVVPLAIFCSTGELPGRQSWQPADDKITAEVNTFAIGLGVATPPVFFSEIANGAQGFASCRQPDDCVIILGEVLKSEHPHVVRALLAHELGHVRQSHLGLAHNSHLMAAIYFVCIALTVSAAVGRAWWLTTGLVFAAVGWAGVIYGGWTFDNALSVTLVAAAIVTACWVVACLMPPRRSPIPALRVLACFFAALALWYCLRSFDNQQKALETDADLAAACLVSPYQVKEYLSKLGKIEEHKFWFDDIYHPTAVQRSNAMAQLDTEVKLQDACAAILK